MICGRISALLSAGLNALYRMIAITEFMIAFIMVAYVVIAKRALIADSAFSALGVNSVNHRYLSAGSNTQLNARAPIAAIEDHLRM